MPTPAPTVDQRAVDLRDLNRIYDLPPHHSLAEWKRRAAELRTHILAVNGLLPMPDPPPLRAEVFGTVQHKDYSVSKVLFQSHPGIMVTGNLWVPRGRSGPFPAVLNPHGHWPKGRLHQDEVGNIPARGISFARQGYVAFTYDMVGYNDSGKQLDHTHETDIERLWALGRMALQLYNAMRAVDFMQSLSNVDPERIGCTGASGGGTQTFMLMAVDDRVKVAAPVNMISAHMQGGCVCENTPSLRLDMTNPELACLMAPRPLLLVSCTGDWTKNTPTVEYPYIKSVYELYGAGDRVESYHIDAGHNYNLDSRNAVYRFFAKWLLGAENPEEFVERPVARQSARKLLVFADREPPRWAVDEERALSGLMRRRAKQIAELWPETPKALEEFRVIMSPALAHLLGARLPAAQEVKAFQTSPQTVGGAVVGRLVLSRPSVGDRIPAALLSPVGVSAPEAATLLISGSGMEGMLGDGAEDRAPLIEALLSAGQTVLLIDVFGVSEASIPAERDERAAAIAHYLTYNRSDDMNRVQDILTALAYLRSRRGIERINLCALRAAGPWALLARSQAPFVDATVVDLNRFPTQRDAAFVSQLMVPGIRSIGDISTAAALIAPGRLCVFNAGRGLDKPSPALAYEAAGAPEALDLVRTALTQAEVAARLC